MHNHQQHLMKKIWTFSKLLRIKYLNHMKWVLYPSTCSFIISIVFQVYSSIPDVKYTKQSFPFRSDEHFAYFNVKEPKDTRRNIGDKQLSVEWRVVGLERVCGFPHCACLRFRSCSLVGNSDASHQCGEKTLE